jgi:hypothetical protein
MSKRAHEDEDAALEAELGDYKEYVPLKHRRMDQVRWCSVLLVVVVGLQSCTVLLVQTEQLG